MSQHDRHNLNNHSPTIRKSLDEMSEADVKTWLAAASRLMADRLPRKCRYLLTVVSDTDRVNWVTILDEERLPSLLHQLALWILKQQEEPPAAPPSEPIEL
jgi:hypothetical protein